MRLECRRPRQETGSAILLLPAMILVLVMLSALTVDYSIAFLAKRELAHAAQAAANDAASALAEARFHANPEVTIDPVRAAVRARAAIERRDSRWIRLSDPEVLVVGDRVIVRLAGAVSTIFSKGVPGGPSEIGVSVEARAQARVR